MTLREKANWRRNPYLIFGSEIPKKSARSTKGVFGHLPVEAFASELTLSHTTALIWKDETKLW